MSSSRTQSLPGKRILIVEHNYFVVYHMAEMPTELGAHVLGPLPTVVAATRMAAPESQVALVLLYRDLCGPMSWPALDVLLQRSILVAITGPVLPHTVPSRYVAVPRCMKPVMPYEVADLIAAG